MNKEEAGSNCVDLKKINKGISSASNFHFFMAVPIHTCITQSISRKLEYTICPPHCVAGRQSLNKSCTVLINNFMRLKFSNVLMCSKSKTRLVVQVNSNTPDSSALDYLFGIVADSGYSMNIVI